MNSTAIIASDIEAEIIKAMNRLRRNNNSVYPYMVKDVILSQLTERKIRYYMKLLARDGLLERRGRHGGYLVISPFDREIIRRVRNLQRTHNQVFPVQVCYGICSVRQMRRHMKRLAEDGFLLRMGERSGYRVVD